MIFLIVFQVAVRVGICILFRPYRDGNTSEYAAFLPVFNYMHSTLVKHVLVWEIGLNSSPEIWVKMGGALLQITREANVDNIVNIKNQNFLVYFKLKNLRLPLALHGSRYHNTLLRVFYLVTCILPSILLNH